MTDIRWRLPTPDPRWALFLDVDGTLIDIAAVPSAVVVPDGLVGTLTTLAPLLDDAVALVSGRSLADLDRLFGALRLTKAGQHGAEIKWPDGRREQFRTGGHGLATLLAPIQHFVDARPGLLIEDKGQTIAIHYRLAPDFQAELGEFLEALVAEHNVSLDIIEGRRVFELKPRGVDKGAAVERLMRSAPFAGRQPVFVGDDTTDEDGFAAARDFGGHAIRVGLIGDSIAEYRLPDPRAARSFLTEIIRRLTPPVHRT